MPLKIVKIEQLTKPTRQKQSVVTSLPEFIEATLKLSHGLKPQEGIEITLPKKDERGYTHSTSQHTVNYLFHNPFRSRRQMTKRAVSVLACPFIFGNAWHYSFSFTVYPIWANTIFVCSCTTKESNESTVWSRF